MIHTYEEEKRQQQIDDMLVTIGQFLSVLPHCRTEQQLYENIVPTVTTLLCGYKLVHSLEVPRIDKVRSLMNTLQEQMVAFNQELSLKICTMRQVEEKRVNNGHKVGSMARYTNHD